MTDYASMDNAALQRVIAERLGYTVKVRYSTYGFGGKTIYRYELRDPRGRKYFDDDPALGPFEPDITWQLAPNWPESVDVALALIPPQSDTFSGVKLDNMFTPKQWRVWLQFEIPMGDNVYEPNVFRGEANTPARAISLAWLAWMDSKETVKK